MSIKTKEESTTKDFGMGSKMRVKLYNAESLMIESDRLVEQATELTMGPKYAHKGPLSVEFNLASEEQIDQIIEYLKQLKGDLPIVAAGTTKKSSPNKTIEKMLSDKEPLLDLIKATKTKGTTQEKLINFLREYNFRFINADVIMDMAENDPKIKEQINLRPKDLEAGYQCMVRMIKEAKDPMNDKYDFRLVFCIKIVGEKTEKVQVYLWGKYDKTWTIPWEKAKEMNFKKVEKVYTFPEFMDYADRKKWRVEHRKLLAHNEAYKDHPEGIPEFETSKFYQKFTPYVKGY